MGERRRGGRGGRGRGKEFFVGKNEKVRVDISGA